MPPKGTKKDTGQSSKDQGPSGEGEAININITTLAAQQFAEALTESLKNPVIIKAIESLIVQSVNKAIQSAIVPIEEKIKQIDEKMEGVLMEAQVSIEKQNDKIEQLNKKIVALSKGVTSVNRHNKRINLKVCGDGLEINDDNRVTSLIESLSQAGIQNIQETDFTSIDKVSISGKENKGIYWLVKMVSEKAKNNLYSQRTKLKNSDKRIFINEDLTKEDAIIFRKARQRVKEGLLLSTWTWNGVVYGKCEANGKSFQIDE